MRLINKEVRKYFHREEEIAHAVAHGMGLLLGIVAFVLLMIKSGVVDEKIYTISMLIYSLSLIVLYTNSMFYHSFLDGKAKNVFERLDHASVYLLIAGTYTPFCLLVVGGTKGIIICSVQWGLAMIGVIFKSIWIEKFVKIHVAIYLLLGWTIILFAGTIMESIHIKGFVLLFAGGLGYSIGVLFYIFDWFKYHHFVWHLFVLVASVLHFFCIYLYV